MTYTGWVIFSFLCSFFLGLLYELFAYERGGCECRFDSKGDGEGRTKKIDFIHLSKDPAHGSGDAVETIHCGEPENRSKSQWAALGYAVLPNLFDDGVYLSDHRAVVGDVSLMSTHQHVLPMNV
jgi:hypothetical protein